MQGKIKNINKKHPKKALTEPQWKNCRVTEAAFRGTVVFPVSEVLLICQLHLCVRPGGQRTPSSSYGHFHPNSFSPPRRDRRQWLSRASPASILTLPPLSVSLSLPIILCFPISLPPPPVFKSGRFSEKRNRINTGEYVRIRGKWHRAGGHKTLISQLFLPPQLIHAQIMAKYFCIFACLRIALVRW